MANTNLIITPRSADRFMAKIQKTDGCWLWTGSLSKFGHGRFNANWKSGPVLAHRFALGLVHGWPIDGWVLHRCDNPKCVNQEHLYIGTPIDNMRDMVARRRHHKHSRTHCRYGHEYAGENLIVFRGVRYCRTCMNRHRRNSKNRRVRCEHCGHNGRRVIPTSGVVQCKACHGRMLTRDQREPKDEDVSAEDV